MFTKLNMQKLCKYNLNAYKFELLFWTYFTDDIFVWAAPKDDTLKLGQSHMVFTSVACDLDGNRLIYSTNFGSQNWHMSSPHLRRYVFYKPVDDNRIQLIYYYYNNNTTTTTNNNNKGTSENVNIFMSLQTVHFFRPPPLEVYRPTFWGSKIWVSHSITFIMQQQKLTLLSIMFDM